jgi:hypothetical protein
MELTILLVVLSIILVIIYEYTKRHEMFQSTTTTEAPKEPPSDLKVTATSYETVVKLYWHRPSRNNDNVYSYLIYVGEPGKDVNLFTIKSSQNKLFYEKIFYNLDPKKKYKFKVRAVSKDGVSEDSNVVELYPRNKNQQRPRPIRPVVNKITCQPDGTFKIGGSCGKPIYPSIDFDDSNHEDLMKTLSKKKNDTILNF